MYVEEAKETVRWGDAGSHRVIVSMPVDVRSIALMVIAVLASIFALRWASAVFIPLLLSLLLTYALSPIVERMSRWHISRWIGSAVVLMVLAGAMASSVFYFADSATNLVDSLPVAAQKVRQRMYTGGAPGSNPLATVQQAAAQLELAADENSGKRPALRGVQRVTIEKPKFDVRDYLWSGTVGLAAMGGQLMLVLFLTFFALGSGPMFRRKLVKMTGKSLEKKKITVHVLDDITKNIERYLLVQILTSVIVGVATWLAFWAIGLENAAVWGIVAGITNLIPYLGSVVVMLGAGVLALLQFDSVQMALLVGGTSLFIHTIVGNIVGPWLTSKSCRMNPVAVFVGVIFWGWLWGLPGLLIGTPLMMVVKSICDHVEDLQSVGELVGD